LGEFWALAYERVIIEPLTTSHQFTGASDDEYAIDSVAGLEYTVDKDFSWFNVQTGQFANVLVDNDIVDPVDYTATSGSTVINLLPTYLNTLTTGSHTLTVRFTDGVSFSSAFSVLAANTGGNNGGNTGGNTGGGSTNPSTPFSPSVPNTGISNLGKLLAENRSVAMAVLGIVIAGLGISIALVGRKLAKES
jgi:hypothetical protein